MYSTGLSACSVEKNKTQQHDQLDRQTPWRIELNMMIETGTTHSQSLVVTIWYTVLRSPVHRDCSMMTCFAFALATRFPTPQRAVNTVHVQYCAVQSIHEKMKSKRPNFIINLYFRFPVLAKLNWTTPHPPPLPPNSSPYPRKVIVWGGFASCVRCHVGWPSNVPARDNSLM
jgi:hypothetical protein